jgi:hypothetical protein
MLKPGLYAKVEDPELETLLHPARAFDYPRDVLKDPDLTPQGEAGNPVVVASDACAIETAPALRRRRPRRLVREEPVCVDPAIGSGISCGDTFN